MNDGTEIFHLEELPGQFQRNSLDKKRGVFRQISGVAENKKSP
jgi:hypothetical protein